MLVVILIGILVGILLFKTLDPLIRLHLFGDYYAWSTVNDVKCVQTGYVQNFLYLMKGLRKYYCSNWA